MDAGEGDSELDETIAYEESLSDLSESGGEIAENVVSDVASESDSSTSSGAEEFVRPRRNRRPPDRFSP